MVANSTATCSIKLLEHMRTLSQGSQRQGHVRVLKGPTEAMSYQVAHADVQTYHVVIFKPACPVIITDIVHPCNDKGSLLIEMLLTEHLVQS